MRRAKLLILRPLASLCFLLAVTLSGGACGDDGVGGGPETCSFDNCSGCCNGSECVTNVTATLCGQAGRSCNRCDQGEICSAGTCTEEADCSQCPNSGCCLNGTQCMEGDSKSACGKNGNACETCTGSDEVCGQDSNTCEQTACNSTTCSDGCCTADGECKKVGAVEQDKDTCGKGGNACEVCDTTDVSCTAGACVPADATCLDFCTDGCCMGKECVVIIEQDNGSCGLPNGNTPTSCEACTVGNSCAQGACISGPAWKITIVSATVAEDKPNGNNWDLFGDPDPKVAGGLGGQPADDFTTEADGGTHSPVWNFEAGAYAQTALVASGLNLVFEDKDPVNSDDMGECTFTITQVDLDAGTKTQAVCGESVTDIKIDFTLVQ